MNTEYSEEQFLEGQVLLINKPLEWTSFDVVNKIRLIIRKRFGIKKIKVGHAGTLDPLATGLVIVCTGKATKQIDQYQGMEKEYVASVCLGATTPSQDLESEIDQRFPYEHITQASLEEALQSFVGDNDQIPPVFSAIKINGRKSYDLARKGAEVELKARKININKMNLISYDLPHFTVEVGCSKGTYIRSLARDIGEKLNSGGHLTGLIRTHIGAYSLENAISMEEFQEKVMSTVTK